VHAQVIGVGVEEREGGGDASACSCMCARMYARVISLCMGVGVGLVVSVGVRGCSMQPKHGGPCAAIFRQAHLGKAPLSHTVREWFRCAQREAYIIHTGP